MTAQSTRLPWSRHPGNRLDNLVVVHPACNKQVRRRNHGVHDHQRRPDRGRHDDPDRRDRLPGWVLRRYPTQLRSDRVRSGSPDGGQAADQSRTAVFTGAGLSGSAPASLPLGYTLRDAVLGFMFEEASHAAQHLVTPRQLAQLSVPARKLEQVLGRLWRVTGSDALESLRCLEINVPNEAHMLAALHVALGGIHATVNLDRGVEVAYGLLAGAIEIPNSWRADYAEALDTWRAVAGKNIHGCRVVASREEFDTWVRDRKPSALLKIHGSLPPDDGDLVDVVVEDTEELGGLTPSRLAAINHLAEFSTLIITGYGGLDPDVYRPLLRAARRTDAVWATKSIDECSQLHTDLTAAGITVRVGDPDGLATTALSDLLDVAPTWPDAWPAGEPTWEDRFTLWRSWFRHSYHPEQFALAWAWLLADSGDSDAAIALLEHLVSRGPGVQTRVRLADALYDRAEVNDRRQANHLYWSLVWNRDVDWALRGHCLLRVGGVARGRAVREPGWRTALDTVVALAMPLVVLAEQRRRGHGKDPELSAAAMAALGQTMLRGCEGLLPWCPENALPILASGLRRAGETCEDAARASSNGNRRALARSHRLLAQALASLLTGDHPDAEWTEELEDLAASYVNAGDSAGAGNCYSALAVVAAATDDWALAELQLHSAREHYVEGRPDDRPIPAGAALIDRLERLFRRMRRRHIEGLD